MIRYLFIALLDDLGAAILRFIKPKYVLYYTCFMVLLLILTVVCYFSLISYLLSIVLSPLLLPLYVICVETIIEDNLLYKKEPYRGKETNKWKLSYNIILVIFGIVCIIAGRKYEQNYHFKCSTVYVDYANGVYHYYSDCDEDNSLIQKRGYEIMDEINSKTLQLCDWCESVAEDAKYAQFDQP